MIDINSRAIDLAKKNAERNGVVAHIFQQTSMKMSQKSLII